MDLSRKKAPALASSAGTGSVAASVPAAASAATAGSDEIIVLPDDEEQEIQKLVAKQAELAESDIDSDAAMALVKEQAVVLRKLRESLRSEECKLALLKAMRHSQQRSASAPGSSHHHQQQKENGAVAGATQSGASRSGASVAAQGRSAGAAALGSQKLSHHQSPSSAIGRSQSAASMPMKTSASVSSSLASTTKATPPPPPPQISQAQLDAQKAQKKLALRKQLEKSLLEIPNPQPPPSELNFVPSTVTNEFIALVGLEEVVRNISEYDAVLKGGKPTEVKYVFHPFTCVQCGTDYTPVWKRDKPGSKNVICEQCVSVNQKNSIRKDHTARLKAAFVKALKQEEEIEKEFKRYSANPQLAAQAFPHLLPPPPQPQAQQHQQQHHHQQQQHSLHGMSSLSSAHRSSSSLHSLSGSSASRLAATTQQQQQQQAAAAAAASQAAATAAAVEQIQRQQFLHAQLQAISQLYPAAGGASASSYPYTMPANYLTMLQQAMRQNMGFNPTSLWSAMSAASQPQQPPGKK